MEGPRERLADSSFFRVLIDMAAAHFSSSVAVARTAMACRFEIVLPGADEVHLRAAAEAALDEIERLEAQLSFYQPTSELTYINNHAAAESVQVEPQFFKLLEKAQKIYQLTAGAFDPTIAPLMRSWGFVGSQGSMPDPRQLEAARAVTGMHLVRLDPNSHSVRFERNGVLLDLGAIGKGYAIERAVETLLDLGIVHAIVHGGASTVYALGKSPEDGDWKVAIPRPTARRPSSLQTGLVGGPASPLAVVSLRDQAMSVSAVWGKSFQADSEVYGHVLDPRLGRPVDGALMAATVTASATDADAYSTALLVLGSTGIELLSQTDSTTGLLVVEPGSAPSREQVSAWGIVCAPL